MGYNLVSLSWRTLSGGPGRRWAADQSEVSVLGPILGYRLKTPFRTRGPYCFFMDYNLLKGKGNVSTLPVGTLDVSNDPKGPTLTKPPADARDVADLVVLTEFPLFYLCVCGHSCAIFRRSTRSRPRRIRPSFSRCLSTFWSTSSSRTRRKRATTERPHVDIEERHRRRRRRRSTFPFDHVYVSRRSLVETRVEIASFLFRFFSLSLLFGVFVLSRNRFALLVEKGKKEEKNCMRRCCSVSLCFSLYLSLSLSLSLSLVSPCFFYQVLEYFTFSDFESIVSTRLESFLFFSVVSSTTRRIQSRFTAKENPALQKRTNKQNQQQKGKRTRQKKKKTNTPALH